MIRPATVEDANSILPIYNDAILNSTAIYAYKEVSLENRQQWLQEKQRVGFPVIVYEEDGQVIGYATFGPFRAFPAYKYSIEHSVYVHKDHHQKGIGTKLMKELITIANREGYATMIACIDASNSGSIRAHEKLGFTYSGTIRKAGYKFGKWLDAAFYQLDLDGPATPTEEE